MSHEEEHIDMAIVNKINVHLRDKCNVPMKDSFRLAMMKIPSYKFYENPKEVKAVYSDTQVAYYCPECGDTIVTWSGNKEKPIIPKFCGHCFCPVFDPVDDIVADIKKAIAESGE